MTRIAILFLSVLLTGTAHAQERFIALSSTTSTQDSGLFDYILPIFKTTTGLSVHVVAVGTGQALAIGERGDADALCWSMIDREKISSSPVASALIGAT